ncbi:beta-galactosidase [Limnochorda pilosa]|uniref:Beta-galactosidase n=1 Tax=Limnochorda pilosa TaxID=1555112 RepID=A0A0K2SIU6_LIMPI|nr:beta-galactosidase [Limnochorda pilosa]BAS27051.1 beta-galactosidase [Limnochorda pilosa]
MSRDEVRWNAILYGGDYNPDQWDEATWAEDLRLLRNAGINAVTVGVFSWARLQPEPDRFDFEWLDRVLARVHEAGLKVVLATPTASPPVWLAQAYDDVLPVGEDGVRFGYGSRRHYCPNSPNYRRHAREIARALAERYGRHPALILWHVDNEYGVHLDRCYCDRCRNGFRQWLATRYGTIDHLNASWTTSFWGQRYNAWSEVDVPRRTPTYKNPAQVLDYRRFMTESFLQCYREQEEVLREQTPDVPVTTNLTLAHGLDFHTWAPHLDVIAWDSYPGPGADPAEVAARHDLMRGLKGGRQPFVLMEQTPSQVNWMPHNPPLRPGELRLLSLQAVAHGADAVCYFQMRQSRGGAEKFHGAVISHEGSERPRVYREVAALGTELQRLAPWVGSEYRAQTAVLFSWPIWWAVQQEPRISADVDYVRECMRYHNALWKHRAEVDIVSPEADLSRYRLVVAPLLRHVDDSLRDRLETYVDAGGTLVLTFQGGLCDPQERVHLGGYPGPLRHLAGVWVEEWDILPAGRTNRVRVNEPRGSFAGSYAAELWCDVVHLEGARPLATFETDYYAGMPAVTEHEVGRGRVVYVGTALEPRGVAALMGWLAADRGLALPIQVPPGVEIARRWRPAGGTERSPSETEYILFVLNHNVHPVSIELPRAFIDVLEGKPIAGRSTLSARGVWALVPSAEAARRP